MKLVTYFLTEFNKLQSLLSIALLNAPCNKYCSPKVNIDPYSKYFHLTVNIVSKYLGSQVAADGGCERDVVHRMNEGYRAWGALRSVLNNRGLGIKAKKCLYEGVIVPTALYGAEAWGMRSAERRKVNVLEMKCLRSLVGVSRMDRVRNEDVRRRAGIEKELASRADESIEIVWTCGKNGGVPYGQKGVDGRSQWGTGTRESEVRLDGLCEGSQTLGNRGMTAEAAHQCAKDRQEWRALVHM